jgi:DNA mismatch endonuclease (patch repair protein)
MDKISPERRSENMRRIRSTGTKPELVVRSLLHKLGYRFRLHRAGLPGRPDIVFPSRCKAIFVHGCFWHQHRDCIDGRVPKSNSEYWREKLLRNTARDAANRRQLAKMGWPTLVIWECKARDEAWLTKQLTRFLDL